jgi:hypothetical protein
MRTRPDHLKCRARKYRDEATARRCLWAMGQQKRIDIDSLTVKPCRVCEAWHIVRK